MSSSPSSSDNTLLSPSAGLSLLKIVDDDKLKALVDVSTFIGTSDGPVTSKTVAAILGETSVQISQDKSMYLSYKSVCSLYWCFGFLLISLSPPSPPLSLSLSFSFFARAVQQQGS